MTLTHRVVDTPCGQVGAGRQGRFFPVSLNFWGDFGLGWVCRIWSGGGWIWGKFFLGDALTPCAPRALCGAPPHRVRRIIPKCANSTIFHQHPICSRIRLFWLVATDQPLAFLVFFGHFGPESLLGFGLHWFFERHDFMPLASLICITLSVQVLS